jgi:hypothetical protein
MIFEEKALNVLLITNQERLDRHISGKIGEVVVCISESVKTNLLAPFINLQRQDIENLIGENCLNVLKLIEERWHIFGKCSLNSAELLGRACNNGHLKIAQWLVERFRITTENFRDACYNEVLRDSCANGRSGAVAGSTFRPHRAGRSVI